MEQRRFNSGNEDSGRRDSRGGGRRFGSGGRSSGGFGGRRFGGQRRFGSGSGFRRRDDEGGGQSRGRFFGSSRDGFGRGGGRFDRGPPREMHKAVCSECKKDCEVPFKPTQGKPVFCRECFQKKKEQEEGY